ncbi:MAG: response regulator [Lachnospiraceae bacterium]|nr:response regulator [Lachnospiraceae bacterium]
MFKRNVKRIAACFIVISLLMGYSACFSYVIAESTNDIITSEDDEASYIGGGYAATGRIKGKGYTFEVYDASNGLPTSDANYIIGTSDGYVLIGGYSGIIKYDGSTFERLDTSYGLTSGRGLFEDSRHRIFVGTNDNGVVIIDGNENTHITYKDGLPSSSIRVFAEDDNGDVYIGTTAGVCYVDNDNTLHVIDDERLNDERILKLESDSNGIIYGQTKNGILFEIIGEKVIKAYKSSDLGLEKITCMLADRNRAGYVYLCGRGTLYYGKFGSDISSLKKISVAPLEEIHWISYDCGRIWVSSISQIGYLNEKGEFEIIENLPFDSGIEMTTSDYQGNIWVASSTMGVMKIVANNFVDLFGVAGLEKEVVNATCLYKGKLYIGTDNGLRILGSDNSVIENDLTSLIGSARIRGVNKDNNGNLWICTYSNTLGLICYNGNSGIKTYTTKDGMPSNEVRCLVSSVDGSVLAGTNGGLAVIKDGRVVRTIDDSDEIRNTVFLTVEEGDDGEIYIGTDGDGIYVIDGDNIRKIGRDEGLTSDVVMRIKKDTKRSIYWLITSNSIEYIRNGSVTEIKSFPYNNNYDMYFDNKDNAWIISSYGIYVVDIESLIKDEVSDYRLYTIANGLTATPTSNSYSALSSSGNLYMACRTGVCEVNINSFAEDRLKVKVGVNSVYCGDEKVLPNEKGEYIIPSLTGRIRITASILDYTLINPLVKVFIEGHENEGLTVRRSKLQPLEYTGLPYGNYVLHIQVMDASGENTIIDETYSIVKKPRFMELRAFRALLIILIAIIAGLIVWRVMKITVIKRQYEEIREAKDEAERANMAKTRFLANMSHEIRTPINTIMGMNEMVLREDASGVPKHYFMSMVNYALDIRGAAESLLGLINDLLDMSKIESGKMHLVEQEYDVQEMLRTIVSMIRVRSAEKELNFDVSIDEILPRRLYGDMGKIKQVVLNLLTNAVKYTEKGGFILSVELEKRENDDCVVRFSVKDTGIGVKEEDMDKLFTAYTRLDEERNSGIQGTGLGLDISRRFAELMGGSLVCKSVYGQGSEFIFTVTQKIIDREPIGLFVEHDENAVKGPYIPKFVAPDADVLVVDDTPMNLSVIKGLLKPTKIFVTTAASGEECLEKIKETKFNVVLLDHMMPGMDGIETMAKIREFDKDLPVYALTANAASGEEFYKSKGFNGYLSKPIDSEMLEKTIMKHLPAEMMEKATEADAIMDLTEIPEKYSFIYKTEGITVEDGIKNSGGISSYIISLKNFKDTIEENAKVIKDAYDAGNIRLYTIKVHALKSSARIIGANELSHFAEELENAGNAGDRNFIDLNTEKALNEYYSFLDKLSGLDDEDDGEGKEEIEAEELKGAYEALKDYCESMDYDSAEMIFEELSKYKLPKEDADKVKKLKVLLKKLDWDTMEELIAK